MTAESARRRASGYALVAVAASSWGMWPWILRHAPMPAALQSAVVMTIMTLGSAPFVFRDRIAKKATTREWLGVAWLGIGDALNIALFFAAYQRTSVAIAVLTHYLTPIFIALAAPFVLRERGGARTYGAVLLSFLGLCLLLEPWRAASGNLVGAMCGAGSAVFYASNVLVNKRLSKAFSASELMFFHGLVATPLLFAMVPVYQFSSVRAASLVVVALGGLGPGVLGGLLFVWGLRRIAASHASVLTLLEPLVAVVMAAALMGESLGAVAVVGGALILAGALVVVWAAPDADRQESDANPRNRVDSPG